MLTRGYLIGEIVDELANLEGQVRMRNRLHLFDLTVIAEDFFKEFLNIALGANLKNLNSDRSNEPGLDLGDSALQLAIQITSSAGTAKVNDTLSKITQKQRRTYKQFIVLGLNKRQASYAIDPALAKQYSFGQDDIWDLDTLARKALDLQLEDLQALHAMVSANMTRLKVDLEIPDERGEYPTSGYALWEERAKAKVGNGKAFAKYFDDQNSDPVDRKAIAKALADLARTLTRLPRLSREFLVMLLERAEDGRSTRFSVGIPHLLLAKVDREYRGDDLKGELAILEHAGFVELSAESDYDLGPAQIGIKIPTEMDELRHGFLDYVQSKELSLRQVIGTVDFSAF